MPCGLGYSIAQAGDSELLKEWTRLRWRLRQQLHRAKNAPPERQQHLLNQVEQYQKRLAELKPCLPVSLARRYNYLKAQEPLRPTKQPTIDFTPPPVPDLFQDPLAHINSTIPPVTR